MVGGSKVDDRKSIVQGSRRVSLAVGERFEEGLGGGATVLDDNDGPLDAVEKSNSEARFN